MKKIIDLNKILPIIKTARHSGKRIVFTNGCFDILHAGHVRYLHKAKILGDVLIVGLNSDSSVRRLKGKERPINNQNDRAEVLSALEVVNYVMIFNEPTPEKLIRAIEPDILAKGEDWKGRDVAGADFVKRKGGRVVFLPLLKGKSTTTIINKIHKKSI